MQLPGQRYAATQLKMTSAVDNGALSRSEGRSIQQRAYKIRGPEYSPNLLPVGEETQYDDCEKTSFIQHYRKSMCSSRFR